ncbi:MAG: glycosyltransferase, partial [Bacteroidales bacterium]|nr:glycosyltransferase [Bacteroidales bacterium]
MKVLFLPAWYPHRRDAMCGLFVRKHAQAVARYADVHVLYMQSEPGLERACYETRREARLTEYYLYYPAARTRLEAWCRKAVAIGRLWRAYRRENGLPDIVHAHVLTWPLWMACLLKGRHGIPFVATEHWSRYMRGQFEGRILRWLTARGLRRAAAVLPVSEALGQSMRACGLHHPNYRVVRNVVDDFFFTEAAKAANPHRILHVCCFDEQTKNNCGLLRAVAALRRKRTDFILYMVGNGKDWAATRAYAESLGLQESVVFTGEVTPQEVHTQLTGAAFSVFFSRYETASVVVAESLSAGRPVLCTAIQAIAEVMDAYT